MQERFLVVALTIVSNGVAHLSTKGVQVLNYLIKRKGSLVSREEIFTRIWKTSYVGDMNTLYTHMAYLRRAIEQDPSNPCNLHTVRGKGYFLNGKWGDWRDEDRFSVGHALVFLECSFFGGICKNTHLENSSPYQV